MKKYVADVFDIDKYTSQGKTKIFLIAGVGSGKSTWVKEVLTQKGSVLFVTSRKAKAEADANNSTFTDAINWFTSDNQTLITNAGLASRIKNIAVNSSKDLDDFVNHFEYIVIDEVHSLAADSLFADSCQTVLSFIEYVSEKGKPIVCMTGTPEPIQYYFEENKWLILDYSSTCNYVHPPKITMIMKPQVIQYIQKVCINNKVIYFANRTTTIAKLCKELLDTGIFDSCEISISVSKSRENTFFDDLKKSIKDKTVREAITISSKETYDSITNSKLLPDQCKILLSTSTLKEGIDIENENIIMFCENHDLSSLIQYFGRARNGKTEVYIIEDSTDHQVQPNKLLYDYARKKEVDAANQYIKEYLCAENDPFISQASFSLQTFVTKNPYIYFDFIRGEFKVHHIKFHEELRLLNNQYWKHRVLEHCNDHGIIPLWFCYPDIMREALRRMAAKKDRYYDTKIDLICRMLYAAYRIDKKTPKAFNDALANLNAPIRIHRGTETKGEYRNKKFWQVLFVEDFALV